MNQLLQRILYIIWMTSLLCLGYFAFAAAAQQTIHLHDHPVLTSIQDARALGNLSADEAILQMYYAAYQPEMLKPEFQMNTGTPPVKCMVPVALEFGEMRSELEQSTIDEITRLTGSAAISTEQSYISPSESLFSTTT